MKHLIKILFLLVLTSLFACTQPVSKPEADKASIDFEKVDYIEITKRAEGDSLEIAKRLIDDQQKEFVQKFNNAQPKGMVKTLKEYHIDVHFKDGAVRHFMVNGSLISEKNDFFFDLGDSTLVESTWKDLNADHLKNIRTVFEDYIHYDESTDSPDDKSLLAKSLKSLDTISSQEDFNLLLNVWMYYDPTDFPSRELVYPVLERNRPVSLEAIKSRMKNKKSWESNDRAPLSELNSLLEEISK